MSRIPWGKYRQTEYGNVPRREPGAWGGARQWTQKEANRIGKTNWATDDLGNWVNAERNFSRTAGKRWERMYWGRISAGKAIVGVRNFMLSPMMLWNFASMAGSAALNHLTNYQLSMLRYNREDNRRMKEIEIGGYLESGFLSQAAATDRQRLVQAMADSNFNGRSFIGNEAAYYRNIF